MQASGDGKDRTSTYKNARDTLTKYHSDYHYIFSKLYEMKQKGENKNKSDSLDVNESFLCANLARKLLETFFSFKFPKDKGNVYNLFEKANEVKPNTDKEKIYKFVNTYSHSAGIGEENNIIENLLGESLTIISSIFNWIKQLDSTHYEEMIEVAKLS